MRIPKNIADKILKDHGGPVSPVLRDFGALLSFARNLGFDPPVLEFAFHPVRKWAFDAAWPDLKIAVEREGGTWVQTRCRCGHTKNEFKSRHHSREGLEKDAEKYNAAAVLGWAVLRFTPGMLKDARSFTTFEELARIRGINANQRREPKTLPG